jgi:Lon protease-like protein
VAPLTLPLFPLPETVLFPHTLLPLHVFEPRYRAMLADCLAGEKRMVVVRLLPGWEREYSGRPPIHTVAGAGQVVEAERLPDGRSNILLEGFARVLIEEELPAPGAYRLARCRVLEDRLPDAGSAPIQRGLEALTASYLRLLREVGRGERALSRLATEAPSPAALIDRVASVVVVGAAQRQRILETLDLGDRLGLVTAAVSEALLARYGGGDCAAEGGRWN